MSQTAKMVTNGFEPKQKNKQTHTPTTHNTYTHAHPCMHKYPVKVLGMGNSQFKLKVNQLI